MQHPPHQNFNRYRKSCPFYKKIEGSSLCVDAFSYGTIPGITAYLLSHFHYDHYIGLNSTFPHRVYCSQITANLVISRLRLPRDHVVTLPMNEVTVIDGCRVTPIDANHCPGSVMFIIGLPSGVHHLHTGDFRAHPVHAAALPRHSLHVHTMYLDTTYCDASYAFPPQDEVIQEAVNIALDANNKKPDTLFVCGSYTIGKERMFTSVADTLGCKVYVRPDKARVMKCVESEVLDRLLVRCREQARVHVLPMGELTLQKLEKYLSSLPAKPRYEQVVAFKPTGWTYKPRTGSGGETYTNPGCSIKPQRKGNVSIYGIPYSEHSSFTELRWFVQWLAPTRVIPTVNVGSREARERMSGHFTQWRHSALHDIWRPSANTQPQAPAPAHAAASAGTQLSHHSNSGRPPPAKQRRLTALDKWLAPTTVAPS